MLCSNTFWLITAILFWTISTAQHDSLINNWNKKIHSHLLDWIHRNWFTVWNSDVVSNLDPELFWYLQFYCRGWKGREALIWSSFSTFEMLCRIIKLLLTGSVHSHSSIVGKSISQVVTKKQKQKKTWMKIMTAAFCQHIRCQEVKQGQELSQLCELSLAQWKVICFECRTSQVQPLDMAEANSCLKTWKAAVHQCWTTLTPCPTHSAVLTSC